MPEIVGRLRTPRLASAPSSPALGEMYFDTGTNTLYWWNGTGWISASGAGADLVYNGSFPANTPYTDGDIVVSNGVAYMCVRPTSATPTAWPSVAGVPQPVVNGQWLKGSSGSVIWSPITAADIAPASGVGGLTYSCVAGNYLPGAWPKSFPAISIPFKSNVTLVATASMYSSAAGMSGFVPTWDGSNCAYYADMFFNEANSHKQLTCTNFINNVAAGSHTVGIALPYGNGLSDLNDRAFFMVTAVATL